MAPAFDPVKDLPDLTGKVVIVTGSTAGIGLATAAVLLRRGAKVYFAARNEEKAKACIKHLEDEGLGPGNGQAVFLSLDLADPREAKRSAEAFLKKEDRLDILINNAALFLKDYELGFGGIQSVMLTNYFAPFVFTETLLPLMKRTDSELKSDVRIVNVSSDAMGLAPLDLHFRTKEDFNVEYKDKYFASFKRYGIIITIRTSSLFLFVSLNGFPYGFSKLVILLWSRELQRSLETDGSNIIVSAVHPGAIYTENTIPSFSKVPWPLSSILILLARLFFSPAMYGAASLTVAAVGEYIRAEAEKYKGAYLIPIGKIGKAPKAGDDKELAKELWDTTWTVVKEWGLL